MTGFFVSLLLSAQIQFASVDPRDTWATKSTENFRIHYLAEEAEEIAHRVAQISEPAFKELTSKFAWVPSGVIHVVLVTRDDVANGFSTPFPYNMIQLQVSPPPAGSGLDEYDEWISLLFTHELTHTIHIDMVKGFNRLWRTLLGRTIIPPTSIPNSVQPQWLIEGIAVDHETLYSSGGRGRSSNVEMYFRVAAMEDRLLPIERATYWNDIYPYGGAAYWYGVRFHQYLRERFGEEKIYEFADLNSRWVLPGLFNFKTRKIFGKSFTRLWDEWRQEEAQTQKQLVQQYQPRNIPSLLVDERDQVRAIVGTPAFDPDKNEFYMVTRARYQGRSLFRLKFDQLGTALPLEKVKGPSPTGRLHWYGDGMILYDQVARPGVYRLTSDLYVLDTETGKSKKLTNGLRLSEAFSWNRQIYAVRTNNMKSQIVRVPIQLPRPDSEDRDSLFDDIESLEDVDALEVVYEAEGYNQIHHPSISPDGRQLLFAMTIENQSRDLFLLELETNRLVRLTRDPYYVLHPSFSPDGRWVIFSRDSELGDSSARVYNAFAIHLSSGQLHPLTDFWTGVFYPVYSGNHLVFGHYAKNGFQPAVKRLDLSDSQGQTLERFELPVRKPPLLRKHGETPDELIETSAYRMGRTLWPHFLIPFWFYTESDTAVGAVTGSRDPLGFHEWQAFAYHFFSPNRPGGSFLYVNSQLPFVRLAFSGGAFISNYGRIWTRADGRIDDYYERTYRGQFSANYAVFQRVLGGQVFASHSVAYEDRRSLLPKPANLIDDPSDFSDPSSVEGALISPEEGQQLLFGTSLSWSTGKAYAPYSINPVNGASLQLSVEYGPKIGSFSDFETLITTLRGEGSLRLFKELSIAARGALGLQWLDVLYQQSFRLGGSIGENPFGSSRRFLLRGLPEGALRGEGIVSGSAELRFPLLSRFAGFGTAPVWIKNFHGALFSDIGQSFQRQDDEFVFFGRTQTGELGFLRQKFQPGFQWDRFTMSIGGELRTNVSLWYAMDYMFRLGYGRVWFLRGQNVLTSSQGFDEIYVQIGPSF